jgi:5-methylcytosine-specific restriction protein A
MEPPVISLMSSDEEEEEAIDGADGEGQEMDNQSSAAGPLRAKRRRRGGGGATSEQNAVAEALTKSMSADALRAAIRAFGMSAGGPSKAVMALRLVRARQAAAASEVVYSDQRGAGSGCTPPRFDSARAGRIAGTLDACRLCGGELPSSRRTFCTDECVHFHLLRTSGSHVRKALAIRDGRRCDMCGVDAGAAYDTARRAVQEAISCSGLTPAIALQMSVAGGPFEAHARLSVSRRQRGGRPRVQQGSFWQADHRIAVHEGGGCCGLDNFRTLCSPCHAHVTAQQASLRASDRRSKGRAAQQSSTSSPGGS